MAAADIMSSEPPIQSWMQREKAVEISALLLRRAHNFFRAIVHIKTRAFTMSTEIYQLLLPPPSNSIRPAVSPPHEAASSSASLEQILPPRRPKPIMIR
jgi:hypothetical protein